MLAREARTCRSTAEEPHGAAPFSGLGTSLESAKARALLLTLDEHRPLPPAVFGRPVDRPFAPRGYELLLALSRETRGR